MPELMKADVRQAVVFQQKGKMGRNIFWGKGRSLRPLEDKVVLLVAFAAEPSVLFLFPFCSKEDLSSLRHQRKGSMAGAVLGFVLTHCRCDLGNRVLDGETPSGEIHAVPFQPQDFATAQTVQGGDLYQRINGILANRLKQRL